MPYKDPEKAKAASRASYKKRMLDPEFREKRRVRLAQYMKTYYKNSPDHRAGVRKRAVQWRKDNLEFSNFQNNLSRYGLTLDQYHAKAESQDFLCAICEGEIEVIDHNHTTQRVRGLLCWCCNSGIGQLKESPELFSKASAYISRWI